MVKKEDKLKMDNALSRAYICGFIAGLQKRDKLRTGIIQHFFKRYYEKSAKDFIEEMVENIDQIKRTLDIKEW